MADAKGRFAAEGVKVEYDYGTSTDYMQLVARANLAHAVVVGEHEPELVVVLQAFADQLLVAQLEDVEGDALRRHQHDPQREESELAHP